MRGRGKLALVRQFDLNDVGTLALENRHGIIDDARDLGIEIVDVEGCGDADGQALDRPFTAAV